ncbi:hypothetical protein C7M84_012027 [Penaeus vannamei]|uniref:Uncharacterized protein n=1 Tax=Penaeus vannamei TaxID=6689 RepID=A0A3R7SPN4_PENVA|nr:hypothetical protein C7M84_012027 [Penaeus vannamei]
MVPASVFRPFMTVIALDGPLAPFNGPRADRAWVPGMVRARVNVNTGITTEEQRKKDGVPGVFICQRSKTGLSEWMIPCAVSLTVEMTVMRMFWKSMQPFQKADNPLLLGGYTRRTFVFRCLSNEHKISLKFTDV